MNIALNNGLTLREIEEVIVQTLRYVGFPAVATALASAAGVIRERGLDTNPVTMVIVASFSRLTPICVQHSRTPPSS